MSRAASVVAPSPVPVLRYLNPARLDPYRKRCGGSDYSALALHMWNVHVSAALQESLSPAEIILRNALDEQLRRWNSIQPAVPGQRAFTEDWLTNPAPPLATLVTVKQRSDIRSYANTARGKRSHDHPRKRAAIEHNDLLSQTSLGLWNSLLPHKRGNPERYEMTSRLWSEATSLAFPNLRNDPSGHATGDRVRRLHALRNRVAHMENLLDVDLESRYRDVLQLLTSIDPSLYTWFSGISRIRSANSLRPHP